MEVDVVVAAVFEKDVSFEALVAAVCVQTERTPGSVVVEKRSQFVFGETAA